MLIGVTYLYLSMYLRHQCNRCTYIMHSLIHIQVQYLDIISICSNSILCL